jgi:uncharacterized membrane protein
MKPFDPRSILFARHAQHVVLVHFPIALCLVGVAFDFVAQWRKSRVLEEVAYYDLLVAAVATLPVMITGLLAWHLQLEGQRLKGTLLLHLVFGILSSCLIWLIWGLHFRARRASQPKPTRFRLALQLVAAGVVAVTAHLGGFLSGVNGAG